MEAAQGLGRGLVLAVPWGVVGPGGGVATHRKQNRTFMLIILKNASRVSMSHLRTYVHVFIHKYVRICSHI